jgi:hypothetical protein
MFHNTLYIILNVSFIINADNISYQALIQLSQPRPIWVRTVQVFQALLLHYDPLKLLCYNSMVLCIIFSVMTVSTIV